MNHEDSSIKAFYLVDYSDGGDGILGRNINSPSDLRGKTIARQNSLLTYIMLRAYLQPAGLTEKDVVLQTMSMPDAAAAFTAKRVDVAITASPWLDQAAQESDGSIIFITKGTNLVADVLIARQHTLDTRKTEILHYLQAIDRATKLIHTNDPTALKIVAEEIGVSSQEVRKQLSWVKLFDIAGNQAIAFNPDHPNSLIQNLDMSAQVAYDIGLTNKRLEVSSLYDDSLIQQASQN